MAVVGHDADGPRYDLPFSAAKLEIESPRIQCICFGGDKLSGRQKLVGFNLAFRFPCAKEVLQLLVLGAWLRALWWSLCERECCESADQNDGDRRSHPHFLLLRKRDQVSTSSRSMCKIGVSCAARKPFVCHRRPTSRGDRWPCASSCTALVN